MKGDNTLAMDLGKHLTNDSVQEGEIFLSKVVLLCVSGKDG